MATKKELQDVETKAVRTREAMGLIAEAHAVQKTLDAASTVRKAKVKAATPKGVWEAKVRRIESDSAKAIKDDVARLAELKAEISDLIVELGESVKNEDHGTASFVKGRDKADFAGLRGLALVYEEIKPLLSTGDPSCRVIFKKS